MLKIADVNRLQFNVPELIGNDWMLITAGGFEKCNTMTASWGGIGVLWNKPVAFIFVRPSRYTYEFIESTEVFTLSFFDEEYRNVLQLCGKVSGREVDKISEAGFKKVESENGSVFFEEAKLVMECRKLYVSDINPDCFFDDSLRKFYPNGDYHRLYVGEILNVYENM